ncbi:HlyD family secretion protein [Paucibacter sp. DJ2R-2]|uniref:HlyD family secretion protein n=1 Tax=Paucibacter sp. DJ2R-2 TaxID=2893558 RepID=UPI0021E4D3F1|nr:HlyD family efflux transporter periplasmic adaptor subunit [Paucibacter sp. DJ2R-2]MCV2436902.1 HlyD family efflux transporter periplasmic adaptor subunit [Paucibacter sp. DJ2R-2]
MSNDSNNTPLFRAEAMQAAQVQWLGSIRIGRPLSFAWVTGVSLAMALSLVAFAKYGEITRKAKLPGLLMPTAGMLSVNAPQAGVLTELLVKEGDWVAAGQPVMRLRSERTTGLGDAALLNAQALVQRRQSLETERLLAQQQQRQRKEALQDRLRSLSAEERQAQAELETNRLRAGLASKSLARYVELAKDSFVSTVQLQQKQEELMDVQLRERNAERSLAALQRDIQATKAELLINETGGRTTLAQVDRGLASLSQEATENEARGGLTLTAAQAGRVSALNLHLGQTVQAGQTLITLVPAAAGVGLEKETAVLEAQLYAPSRTTGFVQKGQTVWLRYAAYPFQKFGMAQGKVVAISESPIAPQDLPAGQAQALLAAAQSNEPLYRITVNLAQQHMNTFERRHVLKAGMSLDADVIQDRRAIWEWVLEPVMAVSALTKNQITSPNHSSRPGG